MNSGCVLLLRHASVDRKPGRLMGCLDPPLNHFGAAQAKAWQALFTAHPPASVFASSLRRAMQTTKLAVPDRAATFSIRQGLREISLGAWEGLTKTEIEERFPGAWEERGKNFADYRPAGGESFQDLADRSVPVLFELAEIARMSSRPVLAVTHAGVIRVLLCHILGMSLNHVFRFQVDHGALTQLGRGPHGFVLQSLNLPPETIPLS